MPIRPHLRNLTFFPVLAVLSVCVLLCGKVTAEDATAADSNSTKKLTIRQQSESSIPWGKLTDEAQEKLQGVLTNATVFHRSPEHKLACDHDVYLHLIRHPELVVNMWELMGVSKLRMSREEDYVINIDDGQGTNSQLELVYGNANLHIFYAEGSYKGSIIPTVNQGRVVLILKTDEAMEEGKPIVTHQLDMFIQFDQSTNQLLVKTLQGLFLKMVDMNFAETTKFISQIDAIIQDNPEGMKRLSGRLTRVQTPIRQKFNSLVERAKAQYVRIATTTEPQPD